MFFLSNNSALAMMKTSTLFPKIVLEYSLYYVWKSKSTWLANNLEGLFTGRLYVVAVDIAVLAA